MVDLRATTRRLDRDVDLLAVAGRSGQLVVRDGIGLAGRGEAARFPAPGALDALAAIEVDDEVGRAGCGAVAFGALPFLPDAAAELIVPATVVGRAEDGTRWVTSIGPAGAPPEPPELPDAEAPSTVEPSTFSVRPGRPPDEWTDAVARATKRIRDGELDKVVLAREVLVDADAPFDVATIITRLRTAYPDCFLTSIDGFVGASPELLVSRQGDVVRAHPMAGTTARRGDPQADARAASALFASPTYRHEHQVTIDVVHDTLLPFCSYIDYEPEPSVVALANVQHLATRVEGRLSHPPASVLDLVGALHPTPAVCGRPRAEALAVIAELEGFDRARYGGTVGWVDAAGNGTWAVAIRCAQIDGASARVFAGNGIVGDSDPDTELAETRAKLQAMLTALIRP
ncbi:MAG: isochorismate synthase [Acidimicrobiia bacterium]|nr:isochorismate synthase [Acidimicrobiia bacterium]